MTLDEKRSRLDARLRELGRIVVAYSGGVDSAFLLLAATEVLGPENAVGVTAESPSLPASELEECRRLAREHGLTHEIIQTHEGDDPRYVANPADRCRFCKSALFSELVPWASERGFNWVASGTNADDTGDWRPGMRAAEEHGIIHPLLEAGLTKDDVRALARAAGLDIWDKPAAACLASRFPYGVEVTPERLAMVERAEDFLRREVGLRQVRVRWSDGAARIECDPAEMPLVFERRGDVTECLTAIGYTGVSLDLRGYRMGSLNEGLVQIQSASR